MALDCLENMFTVLNPSDVPKKAVALLSVPRMLIFSAKLFIALVSTLEHHHRGGRRGNKPLCPSLAIFPAYFGSYP
jgi:hypothetical protein